MAVRDGKQVDDVIECMIREASSCEMRVMQGPLERVEEWNKDLQVSLVHDPTGTGESVMEKTSAACAMEWSIQLEKGLRSSKPGVPVKAVMQMGPRLQQWSRELESCIPSNAMVDLVPGEVALFANAILLRLADAFRGGDKEIRLSVVRVFLFERRHHENGKHRHCKGLLSKGRVANHLELLKRVKSVFDTGDLESKAMALILFGCWADFANDNARIRYLILSSLVSPHDCEVKASLFAAGCFCEISDDFACITMEMLFNMMNSSALSLHVKLAAAQVFSKFKCSYSVANKAYKVVDTYINSVTSNNTSFLLVHCYVFYFVVLNSCSSCGSSFVSIIMFIVYICISLSSLNMLQSGKGEWLERNHEEKIWNPFLSVEVEFWIINTF